MPGTGGNHGGCLTNTSCRCSSRCLADLLSHPNKLLASQALELLLTATHPDMYDWNKPPGHKSTSANNHQHSSKQQQQQPSKHEVDTADTQQHSSQQQQHPALGPDGVLWQQLACLHDTGLLSSLMNLSPDAWPGSGAHAIQLMVFYLTWLRSWWSKVGMCACGRCSSDVQCASISPRHVCLCFWGNLLWLHRILSRFKV